MHNKRDNFSDNISEYGSENCSDYGSDYESDNETNTIETPVPQPPKVEEQMFNTTYSTEQVSPTYPKRQERFDDKFIQKDVMNKIRKIISSPVRDMSNNKESLEDIHLWDYLLSNYGVKEGISLLDAYTREELTNILIIQIDQKDKQAPKFSVIDNISEIYGLPGIHKSLYRILDCSWEEIIKGLVIMTSSDDSKCSYHLLYALTLLVDYQELKEFTELVYRLMGEKYGKFIDRGLPGRNFCLCLIGSAKKDHVKRILQYSLDNGWNDLNNTRVQPSTSSRYEVRPCILSIEKINNQKKIIVGHDALKKYANLVLQKYSEYLGSWDIEEKDS
ncbi:17483_t:CDS:2 [Cetraspora pellucida]|uniref:17483_t:CDS:1 n=1 Tax=Cetraspora pellucida TaxID=1433469 RepID=A0ACA9KZJ0_9GLOM|nr:17483_t:CDS:2 [Cetraspora pellucida]